MTQSCSVKCFSKLWTEVFIFLLFFGQKDLGNCDTSPNTEDTPLNLFTKTICMNSNANSVLRARHKTCFLRPDTGPCRADILQWYYDVRQKKCYRFFWGGCQGNGNKFETKSDCYLYCGLLTSHMPRNIPNYCSLSFDFGTCFGYFQRWAWDYMSKTCKRKIYSGCGGNQNNFETREECWRTCLVGPNNTLSSQMTFTTCIPFDIPDLK